VAVSNHASGSDLFRSRLSSANAARAFTVAMVIALSFSTEFRAISPS